MTADRALAVVAGVLTDARGRVLIAQRRAGGNEAGKWEFAGGKIRPGETALAALRRELREELGIGVDAASELMLVRWRGPPRKLNLHAFSVDAWRGDPRAHEHQDLRWVEPSALICYPMPAPDRPIRARLALPRQYLITPEPQADGDAFVGRFARAIDNPAIGVVSLRAKSLSATARAALAERCLATARALRPELIVLIHAEVELAQALGFDGVHLSASQLLSAAQRPLPESAWVFASCHDARELRAAEALGFDAVTLSPVRTTALHPLSRPIGWRRLGALARSSHTPVYALGGTAPGDLATACTSGAHGIAAIRGLWN
jgi:8-oxo-dGTP diphosphatase